MNLKKQILKILTEDARFTCDKIATMLGVGEKEVSEAIKEMEADGVIVKYTTVVNNDKAGEELVDALVEVKVVPQLRQGFEKIASELTALPEVKAVYLMSGTYDFAISLEGTVMRDVALFISERLSGIEGVTSVTTHFILKKYKEGGVVLDGTSKSKRLAVHE
ncbi:MAG: Lrp/AsnC family transcriptional regulator [Christensenellaceae bacterium]